MASLRILRNIHTNNPTFFFSSSSSSSTFSHYYRHVSPSQHRSIFSTTHLDASWMDKIKGVFTGKKATPDGQVAPDGQVTTDEFTLLRFANELKMAKAAGTFKRFVVGRSSEATFAEAFEKQEAIIRYLGRYDPTGDNLQTSQKQEAAKNCNCTIADVENALAKFTWAKQAHKKMEKLKEEGKPIPTSMAELQKMMGSSPMDLARSNLAKSGQISRNALCPCGSKKRYKRCCGKD